MVSIKEVDVAGLQAMQAQGQLRLIDVRTDAEVARGVIEGTQHIPLHMLPLRADEISDSIPTVFYCQSGARSGQACAFMAAKGHDNVYNLQGGILAWVRSGGDLGGMA
jgi:rhodanese-related sulfurtransferase